MLLSSVQRKSLLERLSLIESSILPMYMAAVVQEWGHNEDFQAAWSNLLACEQFLDKQDYKLMVIQTITRKSYWNMSEYDTFILGLQQMAKQIDMNDVWNNPLQFNADNFSLLNRTANLPLLHSIQMLIQDVTDYLVTYNNDVVLLESSAQDYKTTLRNNYLLWQQQPAQQKAAEEKARRAMKELQREKELSKRNEERLRWRAQKEAEAQAHLEERMRAAREQVELDKLQKHWHDVLRYHINNVSANYHVDLHPALEKKFYDEILQYCMHLKLSINAHDSEPLFKEKFGTLIGKYINLNNMLLKCEQYDDHISKVFLKSAQPKEGATIMLARKQKANADLMNAITDVGLTADASLTKLHQELLLNEAILKANRDGVGIMLVQALLAVLTIGTSVIAKKMFLDGKAQFWKSHGSHLADQLRRDLNMCNPILSISEIKKPRS